MDMSKLFQYTEKYTDAKNEYRIVDIPQKLARTIPAIGRRSKHLLTEQEWRSAGIIQSRGWVLVDRYTTSGYLCFIFKRPLGTDPVSGKINADLKHEATKKLMVEQPWLFDE